MSEEKDELKGILIGLMLGAAVGTVLGILIAPATGNETWRKLKIALEDLPDWRKKKKAGEEQEIIAEWLRTGGRIEE